MNYQQSSSILEKINQAKNILINSHRSPDSDSVSSSTTVSAVLKSLGKKTQIICPDEVHAQLHFIHGAAEIKKVDYASFDFSPYDLFIILDTSSWEQIANIKNYIPPKIDTIVIDHHLTNEVEGAIKLVDTSASATAEIVYKLMQDWNIKPTTEDATALFSGLADDTVFFRYTHDAAAAYSIASELIKAGADKDLFVHEMYNTYDLTAIKFLGKILAEMKIEDTFVWSAIPNAVYVEYGKPDAGKELAANLFSQSIKDTEFGFIIIEKEPGIISISFRSKGKVNVAALSKSLGGGGHHNAAGCTIKGTFEESVTKILDTTRSYLKV